MNPFTIRLLYQMIFLVLFNLLLILALTRFRIFSYDIWLFNFFLHLMVVFLKLFVSLLPFFFLKFLFSSFFMFVILLILFLIYLLKLFLAFLGQFSFHLMVFLHDFGHPFFAKLFFVILNFVLVLHFFEKGYS